jgi:hypothetical protein
MKTSFPALLWFWTKLVEKTVLMSQILFITLPYRLSYVWNWQNISVKMVEKPWKKRRFATVQYVPVQYRKILDRHVTLSTISEWLSARECIIISFIMVCCYKLSFTMFGKFRIPFASEIPEYIRKIIWQNFGRTRACNTWK